jgi:CRISPR/Cas system-associated protein Cas10 (large subunit of type III CRISPR-Cas system)
MIDPFTAFAMAQGAVKGIKAAIALGKDINGLYKEFSSFYQNADAVHIASTKMKMDNIGKSDSQINAQALEIAMASKALREHEKELKDILFWSGNAPVWEEMMAERTRMTKERNAAEKAIADKKQKDREAMYNLLMNSLIFVGSIMCAAPIIWLTFYVITNRGI